ncbi:MAG: flagellar biosynthesis regulator FlaF [Pseudomonadota bacterium]
MSIVARAQSAYNSSDAPARSARQSEYRAFARITHQLHKAEENRDGDFPALAAAVHENRRLWTIIAADVATEGNGLPSELRARLFYLSEFTRAESARVLSGDASAAALVEINTAVMRGLRGEGAPGPKPVPAGA